LQYFYESQFGIELYDPKSSKMETKLVNIFTKNPRTLPNDELVLLLYTHFVENKERNNNVCINVLEKLIELNITGNDLNTKETEEILSQLGYLGLHAGYYLEEQKICQDFINFTTN